MSNTIKLKNGSGSDPSASDLVVGEVALRTDTGKLFTKKDDNSVTEIGGGSGAIDDNSVTGAKLSDNLDIPDDNTIRFGDSQDLQIFHNSSNGNSHINESGSGSLVIKATNTYINSSADEAMIAAIADGAVELYHNNSKKLHTHSGGITVSGSVHMDDNNKYISGSSDDLQIYHDGTSSFISNDTGDLRIQNNDANWLYIEAKPNENSIICKDDAAVELFYDNSKKFETHTNGVTVTGRVSVSGNSGVGLIHGDSVKAVFGDSDDLQIFHNGSLSLIDNTVGNLHIRNQASSGQIKLQPKSGEDGINIIQDGAVELYHDNSKKFETHANGVTVTGRLDLSDNLDMGDSDIIALGDGDDLQMYHESGVSHIQDNVSNTLRISADSIALQSGDKSEAGLVFAKNGSVDLYYDNSKKFETESTGVKVTGNAEVTGNIELPTVNSYIKGNGSNSVLQVDATRTYFYGGSDGIQVRKADNSTHLITVDNSGNTTVSGGVTVTGDVSCNGGAGAVTIAGDSDIRFNNGSWTGEACKIQQHGNSLYLQGGSHSTYSIILRTSDGNDRLRLKSNGHVSVTSGNVEFASGAGIDFSNVSDSGRSVSSNLLNDYEEGAFTPTLSAGGANASGYNIRDGHYVKIGASVTVSFAIEITGKGSMSGDLFVSSLPFEVHSELTGTSLEASGICGYWKHVAPNSSTITIVADQNNYLYFRHTVGPEDDPDQMQASDIDSDFTVRGTITYFTHE